MSKILYFCSKLKWVVRDGKTLENVSVIASNPPCKDVNARFTTVPSKAFSDRNDLGINFFFLKTVLFRLRISA